MFFQGLSSGLRSGWNLLNSAIAMPFQAAGKFTSQYFPYPQKKINYG